MKIYLFALLVGFICPAYAQTSLPSSFGGQPLNLVIPKGYCVIDRKDEIGALHYTLQEKGNIGRNTVAMLFADCKEWARRQTDSSYILKKHGSYLFQLTKGDVLLLPRNFTRADLIKAYVDSDSKRSAMGEPEFTKELKDRLARATVDTPTLNGSVNYGLIDKNEYAVFWGIGSTFQYPGEVVRVTGVVAATLVKQVKVSINLYDSTKGQSAPFKHLLEQQKDLTTRLLLANQ